MDDSEKVLRSRNFTYLHLAMLVLSVHDWLILLDREVKHVWRSEWTISKILFILTRYGTFIDMTLRMTMRKVQYGSISSDACNVLFKAISWSTFLGVSISESILLLRTIAVYSGRKLVTIPLTAAYMAAVVAGVIIHSHYMSMVYVAPPPAPWIDGCYLLQQESRGVPLQFTYSMLLGFELVVVILTASKGFRDFSSGTPLMRVLYRDSIGFFLVLFALSLTAILAHGLAPPEYNAVMISPVRGFHSIVCCRILLNLRRAASPGAGSTTVKTISLTFATAPGQETNQVETLQLEARGARSDDGDSHRQADVERGS